VLFYTSSLGGPFIIPSSVHTEVYSNILLPRVARTAQIMAATPKVLVIAGSDSSGGAGLEADQKTLAAHNVFAFTATTALTAQNTNGVRDVCVTPPEFVSKQIRAVFEDGFLEEEDYGGCAGVVKIGKSDHTGRGLSVRGSRPGAGWLYGDTFTNRAGQRMLCPADLCGTGSRALGRVIDPG
jgi:hypothetical protein